MANNYSPKKADYQSIDLPYANDMHRANGDMDYLQAGNSSGYNTGSTSDNSMLMSMLSENNNSDAGGGSGAGGGTGDSSQITSPAQVKPDTVAGASMSDMYINTWIKSSNYAPKARGFFIDGPTGYIECRDFYSNNATIQGTITATSGAIGGWIIGATTLTGGNTTLDSAGKISVGSGNDIAILDSTDSLYRLVIGNAVYASAPFRVTKVGALTATSATIVGDITANTGYIGGVTGWVIATGTITSVNGLNTTQIASGGTYAYIAGTTGSPQFSVSHTGSLIASDATITGAITATSGQIGGWYINATTLSSNVSEFNSNILIDSFNNFIRVGDSSTHYISIDGAHQRIRSSNYASGVFGAGFNLDSDLLAVGNIEARGLIHSTVFQKDVTSVVGGNVAVLDGDVLDMDMSAVDEGTHTAGANIFASANISRNNASDTYTLVKQFTINSTGSIRIFFQLYSAGGGDIAWADVRLNDVSVYEISTSSTSPVNESFDINSVIPNDTIKIYSHDTLPGFVWIILVNAQLQITENPAFYTAPTVNLD